MIHIKTFIAYAGAILLLAGCSSQSPDVSLGGGTETIGIMGSAVDTSGASVAGALVKLRRTDFIDTAGPHLAKTSVYLADAYTDDTGGFLFKDVDTGAYILEVSGQFGCAALPCTIQANSLVQIPSILLRPYATIGGHIQGHLQFDSTRIRVFIYGLDHATATDMHGDFVFEKIPAGTYSLRFITCSAMYGGYDTVNVHVGPGERIDIGQVGFPQKSLAISAQDSLAVRNLLDSNRLTSIPVSRVVTLDPITRRVIILNLSWYKARTLTSHVGALTELTEAIFDNDSLTGLPTEFGLLKKLRSLSIRNNGLYFFPAILCTLDSLKELYLAGNRLDSLPASLGNLTALSHLDISYNHLSALPAEIGACKSLTSLIAFGNRLSSLPVQIANLRSLQYLLVQTNQISTIPDTLVAWLPDIFFIGVDGNRLCGIPLQTEYWLDRYSINDDWRFSQDCN